MDGDTLVGVVVLQTLIAAGLLGISLWWYKRRGGMEAGEAGRLLWAVWVGFGILSLVVFAVIGLAAVLLGGVVTWAFCVAGTVLGSRLLVRSDRSHEQDIWALTLVFALGYGLLGFFLTLVLVGPVLRSA